MLFNIINVLWNTPSKVSVKIKNGAYNIFLTRKPPFVSVFTVYTQHASSVHLITLFSHTLRKKREVSWNYYYFERNATTNNCTCARTHTKYLITAGVRGRVRNFLLQIPLTLRENSGNVSGKFLQRNNCRSRDIAAESRPRAGSVLWKEKKKMKKKRKKKRRRLYIIFRYARHSTIMRDIHCESSIHVLINTKVLSIT